MLSKGPQKMSRDKTGTRKRDRKTGCKKQNEEENGEKDRYDREMEQTCEEPAESSKKEEKEPAQWSHCAVFQVSSGRLFFFLVAQPQAKERGNSEVMTPK